MICLKCGTNNTDGMKSCIVCGAELEESLTKETATSAILTSDDGGHLKRVRSPLMLPLLTVLGGLSMLAIGVYITNTLSSLPRTPLSEAEQTQVEEETQLPVLEKPLSVLMEARKASEDSAIIAGLNVMAIQAEIFYSENGNTFKGFCTDAKSKELFTELMESKERQYQCAHSPSYFLISAPMQTGEHYCVDSNYNAVIVNSISDEAVSCPTTGQ